MQKKYKILVVDDKESSRNMLKKWLTLDGFPVGTAKSGKDALNKLKKESFDIVFLDLKMPEMDGLETLNILRNKYPEIYVIMISAYGEVDDIIKSIELGAEDFIDKRFKENELWAKIRRAIIKIDLRYESEYLKEEAQKSYQFGHIIGKSKQIKRVIDTIRKVAKSNSTILIQGESGTGKELVAFAIHYNSQRSKKPFIVVNCPALSDTLLEDELFGHEKGAFTDAKEKRIGKLELADNGSLFLDEIGDMSAATQAKVLRVIEHKEFERLGGNKPIKVDVRIIAATNKNLKEAISNKQFREDLYYRLNVIPLNIPPLRERKEDVPLLVQHFLKKYSIEVKKNVIKISPEAENLLMEYDWPGNIRELENAIERAVVLSESDTITQKGLPYDLHELKRDSNHLPFTDLAFREAKIKFERDYFIELLKQTNGNISQAAKKANMDRKNFKDKMRKYSIKKILAF